MILLTASTEHSNIQAWPEQPLAPGYQRFFLAYDQEFCWPQADTSPA